MQIGILEPDNFSKAAIERLGELGPVLTCDGVNRTVVLANAEALFVRLAYRCDGALLAEAPHLKYLCSPTTGHTHIDEDACRDRGVEILSLRGETSFLKTIRATPEHTLGLIIAVIRRYATAFQSDVNAHWDRDLCRGEELMGTTVGIIGYGRVGQRVASYLDALGSHVFWFDPAVETSPSHHVKCASLREVIEKSRIVVLAASCTAGSPPILGTPEIKALSGRYFVNTARGELVDEPALLEAIESDRLLGAAIDVIADETGSPAKERWLRAAKGRNVIVTPHIAGATVTSMHRTEEFLADKLIRRIGSAAGVKEA